MRGTRVATITDVCYSKRLYHLNREEIRSVGWLAGGGPLYRLSSYGPSPNQLRDLAIMQVVVVFLVN